MESKRYLIPQADWDAVASAHWEPFSGPPCHVSQLNGYVLCTFQAASDQKEQYFKDIANAECKTVAELQALKTDSPEIWGIEEIA